MTVLPFLLVLAQDPAPGAPPRATKPQERATFHRPVVGAPASATAAARARREELRKASFFGGHAWRSIGPEVESGRVVDIVQRGNRILVAYATGGLWETTDDGITFKPLFDASGTYGIGAIAASKDGKTLWVGTGEANSQRTSYAGDGIWKSTDGGATWRNVGLPESHHIGKVLVDPRDEDTVYVAVLGHLYSQNGERGLYRTRDGGRTWQLVLKGDDTTGAIEVALDERNPKVLLASMWDRDRRAWNFRESGAGSGVWRSTDGGTSWNRVRGLPVGDAAGRTGLAMVGRTAYAFVDNQSDDERWREGDERAAGGRLTRARFLRLTDATLKDVEDKALEEFLKAYPDAKLTPAEVKTLGVAAVKTRLTEKYPDLFRGGLVGSELWRSDDAGLTWRRTALGDLGGYYWGRVFANPRNPEDVVVTGLPLLRSTDGGKTFREIAEDAHVDHHSVVWDERAGGERLWIGNDGGLYDSPDGGKTVRHLNSLAVGQATTLAVDDKKPYNVYLGFQDNGTQVGPSTHVPGRRIEEWTSIFGGDGSAIAIDPRKDRDVVYVAYQFGEHFAIDRRRQLGGPSYDPGTADSPTRRITPPNVKGEKPNRFNWISPIAIDPFVPDILYIGSQRLHRSFDGGRKWSAISPDLTRDLPNGDVPFSTLKDVSPSPLRFGLIYCGADDGRITMTPDGGATWKDIPTPTPTRWTSRIVASRHAENTVFAAQSGYREDDFAAYLYRSDDRGATWRSIAAGLPGETVNVVREDPKDPTILYVGTDGGAYVTFDAAATWEMLPGGLPAGVPVHDLAIQERDDELVIATHGRSAYVLPLKPLRALTPAVRAGGLVLIEAPAVRRSSSLGYERTSRWEEAKSPLVAFTAFAPSAGKGRVRLKDKDGKVVLDREMSFVRGWNALSTPLRLTDPTPLGTAPTGVAATRDEALADPFAANRATYPVAGDYVLEIELEGKKSTKPWTLNPPIGG